MSLLKGTHTKVQVKYGTFVLKKGKKVGTYYSSSSQGRMNNGTGWEILTGCSWPGAHQAGYNIILLNDPGVGSL
jgi:hypothetical protein